MESHFNIGPVIGMQLTCSVNERIRICWISSVVVDDDDDYCHIFCRLFVNYSLLVNSIITTNGLN